MNIFVLNTGRCGSATFIRACGHIRNYTASHESRSYICGNERLRYPENHIEADNRLVWFLGRLDQEFGEEAFYVHLTRNHQDTAKSLMRRWDSGIIKAYREGILLDSNMQNPSLDLCLDYCRTVDSNIRTFLKDKPRTLEVSLENIKCDFAIFWSKIHAEGSIGKALAEWDVRYNASPIAVSTTDAEALARSAMSNYVAGNLILAVKLAVKGLCRDRRNKTLWILIIKALLKTLLFRGTRRVPST